MPGFIAVKKNIIVFLSFLVITFILYAPILDNPFLSDDYDAIYRTTREGRILIKNFLRPVNDISVYFNYLFFGLDATGYYVFNLLIHVINAWLLYRFVFTFSPFQNQDREIFSCMAAFLFLIYPFHTESIVWLSGRLSSMACCFMLMALNIMYSNLSPWKKKWIAALLYFIGLHTYEAILFLPAIILVFQWRPGQSLKSWSGDIIFWASIMLFYFVWRYWLLGIMFGDYEKRLFFSAGMGGYLARALKTLGRTVLPPDKDAGRMTILFCAAVVTLLLLHYLMIKRLKADKNRLLKYYQAILAFFIAISIPLLFGISSHTSEGDRLLYIPSSFLCIIISFFLFVLLRNNIYRFAMLLLLVAYSIGFTIRNNSLWEKASAASSQIMGIIQENKQKRLLLINMPEEIEGAFIFQNAFYRALILNGIDTSGVTVSNYLKSNQCTAAGPILTKKGNYTSIYPQITVEDTGVEWRVSHSKGEVIKVLKKDNSAIYYWDCREMVKLF